MLGSNFCYFWWQDISRLHRIENSEGLLINHSMFNFGWWCTCIGIKILLYTSKCEGIEQGPKNYASDCLKYPVLCCMHDWWIVLNDHKLCFPCVFLPVVFDLLKKEADCIGNTQSTSESIQDSTYLSNEKDISLWKMLVASPTKCNVFVGGLSPEVSSEILHAAFKTFIVEEEEKDKLKVSKYHYLAVRFWYAQYNDIRCISMFNTAA